MSIWDKLQHFSKHERWGDPDKIDPALLFVLDAVRDRVGHAFHINCAYAVSGHSGKSQHYLGKAVDFVVSGIEFEEAYRLLQEALEDLGIADQVGFGAYPQWNTPGFHLDVRGHRARWGLLNGDYVGIEYAMKGART